MVRRSVPILALVAATAVAAHALRPPAPVLARPLSTLPMVMEDWQGARVPDFNADIVAQLHVDDYLNRRYFTADGHAVDLYVGYYRSQSQGAAIHSPLNCLPGAGWMPVRSDRIAFAGGTARRMLVERGGRRLFVMYWYQSARRVEGDEYRSRMFTAVDTLRDRRNDAALVRLIVPLDGADAVELQAAGTATTFAGEIEPYVRSVLFPDVNSLGGRTPA